MCALFSLLFFVIRQPFHLKHFVSNFYLIFFSCVMNQLEQECFAGAPQDFLICITVHKAANTGITSGELYVKVRLDKMSKNTKTFANSENPFFNEVSKG